MDVVMQFARHFPPSWINEGELEHHCTLMEQVSLVHVDATGFREMPLATATSKFDGMEYRSFWALQYLRWRNDGTGPVLANSTIEEE